MSADTLFSRATSALTTAIASFFVGTPRFLYKAGFADQYMEPIHDPLLLGPLHKISSQGVPFPDSAMTMYSVSPRYPRGAARFTLERPEGMSGPIALGVVLHTFPANLKVFRILATCSYPRGPFAPMNAWATALHARSAANVEPSAREKKILVTLQGSWNDDNEEQPRPGARMNTPLPGMSGVGTGPWLPQHVFNTLFPSQPASPLNDDDTGSVPPPPRIPVFSLQMQVDRRVPVGTATLYVKAEGPGYIVDPGPGYLVGYSESREWVHPFMSPQGTSFMDDIAATGIHVAIVGGDGPVAVTLEDFMIYGLTGWDILGDLLGVPWMPESIGAIIRASRERLINWAFAGVAGKFR